MSSKTNFWVCNSKFFEDKTLLLKEVEVEDIMKLIFSKSFHQPL